MKHYKYKPYKIHINQHLYPNDQEQRLRFCQWDIDRCDTMLNFYRNIIWTDEAHISSAGIFNRHNYHHWANKNLHIIHTCFNYTLKLKINFIAF